MAESPAPVRSKKRRTIVYTPLDEIAPALVNPKDHDDALIGRSISRFGFIEPIVVDERTGKLVAGHGRVDELRRRRDAGEPPPEGIVVKGGVWQAPVARGWSSLSDADAHDAGIALNRTGERGGWKKDELYAYLDERRQASTDDVDLLDGLGFDPPDLDLMLAELERDKIDDDGSGRSSSDPLPDTREIVVPEKGSERTKRGDVWILGGHRVMCGDCRNADDVAQLLGDLAVNVAFTSPPYADRRKYDETSGFEPIRPDDYVEWYAPVAENIAAHITNDGSSFINIKASVTPSGVDSELYVLDLVLAHARLWGWHYVTEFCWERPGVPKRVKRRFKNQFEPVYMFTRGDDWKIRPEAVRTPSDNVPSPVPGSGIYGDPETWQGGGQKGIGATTWDREQGGPDIFATKRRAHGTNRSDMYDAQGENWEPGEFIGPGLAYPGNRLPTFSGSHQATGHTAAFPIGLPAWFVRAYTDAGDVVYDPFLGSGSTVLAAAEEKRIGRGMELSPGYVDVVCARYQKASGALPVLESSGDAVDFFPVL